MATGVRIQCINKANRYDPHERIQNVGGIGSDGERWKKSQAQAIADIESGTINYFVIVNSQSVNVIVAVHNGHKYIKTIADELLPNNLLSLWECP